MKFKLDTSGLFYVDQSMVRLVNPPAGVVRYGIYQVLDPPKLITFTGKFYNFRNGEYLEVVKEDLTREFFQFEDGAFVKCTFDPIDEYQEGDYLLGKHLGIYNDN